MMHTDHMMSKKDMKKMPMKPKQMKASHQKMQKEHPAMTGLKMAYSK